MNKAIITGNLGRDIELRYTQTGKAVAAFSIAVTEKWSSGGEKKERTDWINVVAWDKLGELCGQYLSKGSKVLVEGKIQTRSYEDKNGMKRTVTEIVASSVEFLNTKKNGGNGGHDDDRESGSPALSDDDIPF